MTTGTGARLTSYLYRTNDVNNQPNGNSLQPISAPSSFVYIYWPDFDAATYSGKDVTGVVIGSAGSGSGFDSILSIFRTDSSTSPSNLATQVAYNDDGFQGTLNSQVTFTAYSGYMYAPVIQAYEASKVFSGGSPYYAEFSADLASNYNIGTINGQASVQDFVGLSDQLDVFRFTIPSARNVTISLTGLTGNAALQLKNISDNSLAYSNNSGTSGESITAYLSAGTYRAFVTAPEANSANAFNQAAANLVNGNAITVSSRYTLTVSAPDPLTGLSDPVYRFYNTHTGFHFYTSNTAERDTVIGNPDWGYQYEGPAFKVANTQTDPSLTPLFRFYNTAVGNHFYTVSAAERDSIISSLPQYQYEGTAFYVRGASDNIGTDVYRFYNTQTSAHFYTASAAERDSVIASLPSFVYEGAAFEVAV